MITDNLGAVGRRVAWVSQGAGFDREKTGTVVAARASRASPWVWMSQAEKDLNQGTPATEHYNGQTPSRASHLARFIVRLAATSGRQLHNRYYTPHASLLTLIGPTVEGRAGR